MGKCKGDMGYSSVPGRLDVLLDDVNPGTMLKHLVDDQRWAMIVDFVGIGPSIVAVEVKKKIRNGEEEPEGPKDYQLFIVENYEEWLVMARGNDYELMK